MAGFVFTTGSTGIGDASIVWESASDIRVMLLKGSGRPVIGNATIAAVLAETDVDECNATSYARQTLASCVDTVSGTKTLYDSSNATFSSLGGTTDNSLTGAVIYKGTTSSGDDSTNVPIAYIQFATPWDTDGDDLLLAKHTTNKWFYNDSSDGWAAPFSGPVGGEPTTITRQLTPSCGGLINYPVPPTNPITINPETGQAQIHPSLISGPQKLGGVPLVNQMDLTSRAATMPVGGEVGGIGTDVIQVVLPDGTTVTVAKPPPIQGGGDTDGDGDGGSAYTMGEPVIAENVDGGFDGDGNPLPGIGIGTGVNGVSYVETTGGAGAAAGGTTGHTGDVVIGGETIVTAVSCSGGDLSVTTGTTTTHTLTFADGLLESVS